MKVKAAAYMRVSTEAQADEDRYGLPAQKDELEVYALKHGIEIVAWYCDEGISGATLDRPALQECLHDAFENGISLLLVPKLDRLSRDLMGQLWLEKEFLKKKVEVLSVSEPFRGQDPVNVLFRQIIGAFAEFEKSRITERMLRGRKSKAKTGAFAGGNTPYGYRPGGKGQCLDVDPDKAPAVKKLYALRKRHPSWSLQALANRLNEHGYTTAQGKPFGRVQVKRLLDNTEIYRGVYCYGGERAVDAHPAII